LRRVRRAGLEENGLLLCGCCGEAIDVPPGLEDRRFVLPLQAGLLCRECRLAAPEFARAVHFATFGAELRSLIVMLKFQRVRAAARTLAPFLAAAILKLEQEAATDLLVVGVPLHGRRQRHRGFNQSQLLGDAALRLLKKLRPAWKLRASHDLLVRSRHTESSFLLSRKGRRTNLRGAFEVVGDVLGREVLLVDDIYTSGATARECARVLRRAGAAKVWVATVARTQKDEFAREELGRRESGAEDLVARWDLAPT
jgi:ComF family protein